MMCLAEFYKYLSSDNKYNDHTNSFLLHDMAPRILI